MLEVEQKFRINDSDRLLASLKQLHAVEGALEHHIDVYFQHPCRDFAATTEALRVRTINGVPMVTYKGTKIPGDVKAREELEWCLDPGDHDGGKMQSLFIRLGFQKVATVAKTRRSFTLKSDPSDFVITIDDLDELGLYTEIELIVDDLADVPLARQRITALAHGLGLRDSEPRSYLRIVTESAEKGRNF